MVLIFRCRRYNFVPERGGNDASYALEPPGLRLHAAPVMCALNCRRASEIAGEHPEIAGEHPEIAGGHPGIAGVSSTELVGDIQK